MIFIVCQLYLLNMLLKQNKICIFVSQEKNASSWKIRVIVLKRLNSQGSYFECKWQTPY